MTRARHYTEWGLLAIVAVMPFHAFLSVWAGHLFGHQAVWQSWKEAVVVIIVALAAYLLWRQPELMRRYRTPLGYAIAGFIIVVLLVTLIDRPGINAAVFGLKIDVEFLVVFLIALLASSRALTLRLTRVLIISSAGVIGFGLLQIFLLPKDFLAHFGYNASTIVPYQVVGSASHMTRIISTLGGANQLGEFLILPICLVIGLLIRRPRWWQPFFLLGGAIVEWHTYSRSGLLGLAVGVVITVILSVPKRLRLMSVALLAAAGLAVVIVFTVSPAPRHAIYHGGLTTGAPTSDSQHLTAFQAGVQQAETHPLGEGLGAAGPASFHGTHAFIPESYYLQMAVEAGVLGLIFYLATQILVGVSLWRSRTISKTAPSVLGALVGIGVVNLFLHGWADSSTALVFWAYAGTVVGQKA